MRILFFKTALILSVVFASLLAAADIAEKTDITPVKDPLERVLQLRGVNYYWKNKEKYGDRRQLGVVAQEVEKVFPEAVTSDAQDVKTISYSALIAPLIDSIRSLYVKLLSHETQLSVLYSRIDNLEQLSHRGPASNGRVEELESENVKLKAKLEKLDAIQSWACSQTPRPGFCAAQPAKE